MSLQQTINYDTAGNFTYDSNFIEVSSGVARLKDLRPANATFFATYTSSVNATYSAGSATGTANGGAAVSSGKLNLNGGTVKYVDYSATSNASFTGVGAIRFKVTPNYSNTPSAQRNFFTLMDNGGTLASLITLLHNTSGFLQLEIRDSAESNIVSYTGPSWLPVSGTAYEFLVVVDIVSGATKIFIDGTQYGVTQTGTGTRLASEVFRVGSNRLASIASNFQIDDIVVYTTPPFTSTYTPGYTLYDTQYSITNPTITVNSGQLMDGLEAFSESATKTGSDEIKYVFLVDGVAKYFNGSSWVNSSGVYSQSNTASEIDTNAASLNLSSGATVRVRAFLHSDDGSTRPSLTSVSFDYNFFVAEVEPSKCIVYAWSKDIVNNDAQDVVLVVENKSAFFSGNHLVKPDVQEFEFTDGYAEAELVETESSSKTYKVSIRYSLSGETFTRALGTIEVPNQSTVALSSILSL